MNKAFEPETRNPGGDNAGVPPPVVLQVLPSLITGGVERGTIDIAVALAKAGARTYVASAGGPMVRELDRAHVEHVTLPLDSKNPFVMRRNISRLEGMIRERGIELVHARSRAPAWSAYYAARHMGVPFVTTFHGTYGAGNALKRLYNAVMTKGDRVIAISNFIAAHIRETYGTDPAKIRVIERGVDTDILDRSKVPPARLIQLAEEWRLPDGAPMVMLPGRLTRWKGQTVFVDALAQLARSDICAVILGSDQGRVGYTEELEALVRAKGLGGIVRLVGHTSDMPAAYMLADVVVSASTDPEAFGRVIAEAGAMGRPVIATDHGGAREQVIEGETGWLVPPGDAGALAAAIEGALALSKATREQMARRAIDHVREHFAKATMCARTIALYREVAAAAPRRTIA